MHVYFITPQPRSSSHPAISASTSADHLVLSSIYRTRNQQHIHYTMNPFPLTPPRTTSHKIFILPQPIFLIRCNMARSLISHSRTRIHTQFNSKKTGRLSKRCRLTSSHTTHLRSQLMILPALSFRIHGSATKPKQPFIFLTP